MKIVIIISFFSLVSSFASAQDNETWFAFGDEETLLMGFKDTSGTIKIEPTFMGLTTAFKFNNIIAVMEETNDSLSSYYLLKNGTRVGVDSLYIWDNSFDCESEGLIRFRDSKTDKVGYFDILGVVVIPALYNDASPFRNGLAAAIKGAKKICWEGGEFSKDNPCEHWDWNGGQTMLIDKDNNILIDNFESSIELDFYSLQVNKTTIENSFIKTFTGSNGSFYCFIDVEKHFAQWLFDSLLSDIDEEILLSNSYNKIVYWQDSSGWVFKDSRSYIDQNHETLITNLLEIKNDAADFFISIDGLNPYIYTSEEFDIYFDDCGNAKIWMHPVLQVVISHGVESDFYQNHFEFLKTTDGYKLISITTK